MIGGMSWESTLEYYRLLNVKVKQALGGLHSAECLMYSVDFDAIEVMQRSGQWEKLTAEMIDIARNLEKAGAELLMIYTNTMHMMADQVQESIDIPLLHIADSAAAAVRRKSLEKVALLGTRFTMEQDFYKGRLLRNYGIEVIVPENEDMNIVHDIIYGELCLGELKASSKDKYLKIIDKLTAAGAGGVILGCTEIPLLIKQEDVSVPVFNTMELHAEAAVAAATA